ncbi:60S ribosomal protein L14 [Lingula anatina]|uniref:Large ribosomal subunit protein eL14 n=1 Tax=Lingula anatina TaxID=7574 RepID=A0A1S3HY85_LINAN|nr:60S ribosomal protein L14 [Lingula anatina]|eukprot:XP_013390990.1 60S ribosomal protein L14 [Lingula anatina]
MNFASRSSHIYSLQGFSRYVEIGRVAFVAFGPDQGKLVAISDVIDQNRALVDGPCTGVARKCMNLKQLHLTKYVLKYGHGARTGTIRKAWEKAKISEQWAESTWAKKLARREQRAQLTDFDRFKLMKAKQARNRLIAIEYGKLKKAAKGTKPKPKRAKPNKKVHKKQ